METKNIIRKLKKLFSAWKILKKNENLPAKRRTMNLKQKEIDYINSLSSTIFDISKKNLSNHKGDKDEDNRAINNDDTLSNISSQVTQLSMQDEDTVDEYEPPRKYPKKRVKSHNHILASTLNRCGTSDRKGALIMHAIGVEQGGKEQRIATIRSSLRRKRATTRNAIETNVEKLSFSPLTVHWDRKYVKKKDKSKVELLPVVVSSGSDEQLLFCVLPKHGTGEDISKSVFQSLE
ncbi:hypothetical protein TKK_0005793 [Trichogramma kaykai]